MFFPFPHIIFNNCMACTLSKHTAVSTVYFFTFNSYKLQVCTLLFNPYYHFLFQGLITYLGYPKLLLCGILQQVLTCWVLMCWDEFDYGIFMLEKPGGEEIPGSGFPEYLEDITAFCFSVIVLLLKSLVVISFFSPYESLLNRFQRTFSLNLKSCNFNRHIF